MARATVPAPVTAAPAGRPRRAAIAALEVPAFRALWFSGWAWHITRWMAIFLCSYLVNDLTGSPFAVQATGAMFFAPMFFGGAFAGVVADRFDRRRTIQRQLLVLIPLAILMGVLVLTDAIRAWMVFPFMLAVGVGGVVDMTSRRALAYEIAGEERATNALALETLAMSGGTSLGGLFGGAVVDVLGMGQAFLLIAALYGLAFLLLLRVPSTQHARTAKDAASPLADLREGLHGVLGSPALVSILGVTVIMNFFYYSHMPLTPVFADRMGVGATLAGLLSSGQGLGMMIGSLALAARPAGRRGAVYLGGSVLALSFLLLFTTLQVYPVALLLLIAAGVGSAGFGTMQGVLVMTASGPELRGRAMGVLSMAIGSLPFGALALGAAAQVTSPPFAVGTSVILGFGVLAAWTIRRPQALRMR